MQLRFISKAIYGDVEGRGNLANESRQSFGEWVAAAWGRSAKGERAWLTLGFPHPQPSGEGRLMVEKAQALLTAQNLMERALELLDEVGESAPAVHLQMALDVLTGAPIPRSLEEAEAMLDTKEARTLMARLMGPEPFNRDGPAEAPSPEAIDRAATMVKLHSDKALGRTRMQLYEALGRRDTEEINLLSMVCSILMRGGYR